MHYKIYFLTFQPQEDVVISFFFLLLKGKEIVIKSAFSFKTARHGMQISAKGIVVFYLTMTQTKIERTNTVNSFTELQV